VYFRPDVHEIAVRRDEKKSEEEKIDRLAEILRERDKLLGR